MVQDNDPTTNGEYLTKYKNPDFKVTGENKVIEVFGDYWHRNEFPEDLVDAFAGIGIECLVVQESDIMNAPKKVQEEVMLFLDNIGG